MVKGIAVVLLRVLGVWFCLSGIVYLPWTITAFGAMGDQAIDNAVYIAAMAGSGLLLMIFSRPLASLISPRTDVPAGEQTVLNTEALVSAGTILIALYLLINGVANLTAPFLELLEFLWNKTSTMARDHEEEFLSYGESIIVRYDYVIAGIARIVLALIVLLVHPRIARLARRGTT